MDELLLEIEHRSRKDGVRAISRETGRLLSVLVTAMQASRILEVGTGYGDATLAMALAQPRMGKIWTIDTEMHHTDVARTYFERTGEDDYIEVFNTPALELLENFPQRNLDIAFIAANPAEYGEYLELLLPILKLSGLAIFARCNDDTPAMREFRERFLAHPALDAMILPIGDGTAIGARRA